MARRDVPPHTPHDYQEAPDVTGVVATFDDSAGLIVPNPGGGPPARKGDTGIFSRLLQADEQRNETSEDRHRQILEEILSRTSIDEILSAPEATPATEIVGKPLKVTGFKLMESEFVEGAPMYSIMKATMLETGEPVVVTCGWQALSAQLQAAAQVDEVVAAEKEGREARYGMVWQWAFIAPFHCMVYQLRRPNRHGKYPLRLVGLPKT